MHSPRNLGNLAKFKCLFPDKPVSPINLAPLQGQRMIFSHRDSK